MVEAADPAEHERIEGEAIAAIQQYGKHDGFVDQRFRAHIHVSSSEHRLSEHGEGGEAKADSAAYLGAVGESGAEQRSQVAEQMGEGDEAAIIQLDGRGESHPRSAMGVTLRCVCSGSGGGSGGGNGVHGCGGRQRGW